MAVGSSQSEHQVGEVPPSAVRFLASLSSHGSSSDKAASACMLLEVMNISGHVSFLMFWVQHRAASREGRVILLFKPLLCVNVISKEVKGCAGKAEPLSWSVAASVPVG